MQSATLHSSVSLKRIQRILFNCANYSTVLRGGQRTCRKFFPKAPKKCDSTLSRQNPAPGDGQIRWDVPY